MTKLKLLSGKVRRSVLNCLNQSLIRRSFSENVFEATLSPKRNVVSVWEGPFSVFSNVLGDEVETIFWKTQAKRSKLFKSKLGHSKLIRKWFWSYLELKHEYCQPLKWTFFSCLKVFEWRGWNHFLVIRRVLENDFDATFSSKANVPSGWKGHFLVFSKFWMRKLQPFSGKVRQSIQNYLNYNLVIGSLLKNYFEATLSSK